MMELSTNERAGQGFSPDDVGFLFRGAINAARAHLLKKPAHSGCFFQHSSDLFGCGHASEKNFHFAERKAI
jgi:hypothetical protein